MNEENDDTTGGTTDEWKATWQTRSSVNPRVAKQDTLITGIPRASADAMEALLLHYPWIVFLGYIFWRNLLIRAPRLGYGSELEDHDLEPQFVTAAGLGPKKLGVMGLLNQFSKQILPQDFLRRRVPLSGCNWMLRSRTFVVGLGEVSGVVRESINQVGEFLLSIMVTDQIDILKILLDDLQLNVNGEDWGAEVDSINDEPKIFISGCSPFHLALHAARNEDTPSLAIPSLLLRRGACVSTKDLNHKQDPFNLVLRASAPDPLMSLLLQYGFKCPRDAILKLVQVQDASALSKETAALVLAQPSVDVNAEGSQAKTAVHRAIWSSAVLQTLLNHGPTDVNAKDVRGNTPLHMAAMFGLGESLATLLRCPRVNVNATNHKGQSPLHVAKAETLKLLLGDFGVDVNLRDSDNQTPLHSAAESLHHGPEKVAALFARPQVKLDAQC